MGEQTASPREIEKQCIMIHGSAEGILGQETLATGQYTLANVATADGLRGRGWYGPMAVQQPLLGKNDFAFLRIR